MPLLQEKMAHEMGRRQLTFHDVETLCDISGQMVMDILAGKVPREDIVQKVCEGLHLDRDDIVTDPLNMSIKEAAAMTGRSQYFIRTAVEQKRMPGTCIISENGTRAFHIPRRAFMKYMEEYQSSNLESLVNMLFDKLNDKFEQQKA